MVKKPASVLSWHCCSILSLLEHMDSLPSTLPQRPALQNFLLLLIPFVVLQPVHICFVNLVPHPGERLCWGPGTSHGLCELPSLLRDFPRNQGTVGSVEHSKLALLEGLE